MSTNIKFSESLNFFIRVKRIVGNGVLFTRQEYVPVGNMPSLNFNLLSKRQTIYSAWLFFDTSSYIQVC